VPSGSPYSKSSSNCGESCVAYVKKKNSTSSTSRNNHQQQQQQQLPFHFCCCTGSNCNANVRVEYVDNTEEELLLLQQQQKNKKDNNDKSDSSSIAVIVVVTSVVMVVMAVVVVIVGAMARKSNLLRGTFFRGGKSGTGGVVDPAAGTENDTAGNSVESSFLLPRSVNEANERKDPWKRNRDEFSVTQQIGTVLFI